DPMSPSARIAVMRLFLVAGQVDAARSHYKTAQRLFSELDPLKEKVLTAGWHALRHATRATEAGSEPPPPARDIKCAPVSEPRATEVPLLGRDAEYAQLREITQAVRAEPRARIVLLTGEPGIGKSRLLAELRRHTERDGGSVLEGAAF